ncbi:hypothetical protein J1N35_021640 [Gossypium stocksii]|uniref:Endonuclease/exonuclease/phosphatase domain-containing protein n=1 Tax=Gossypium stocksii TaxID=47602 RepID=A0A9D4A2N9_9ROSI|nr:hypothetical protein J1N35_021640 [Gossypium stocksii]
MFRVMNSWMTLMEFEIEVHPQFIHIRIWDKRCRRPFPYTAIYTSPQRGTRAQLWEYLDKLALGINEPWLLSGDFNVIMNSDERQGEPFKNKSGCSQFRSFFFEHGFFDLGFQGPKFTWSRGTLFQRLDRSLCNKDWQNFASYTTVRHLHKLKSDHRPLLVSMNPVRLEQGFRPFRFLASWLSHPEFRDVVLKA